MTARWCKPLHTFCIVSASALFAFPIAAAEKEGDWTEVRDEKTGVLVQTMELTLHAAAEPVPALKYRLIPDDFDRLDGNSAPFYLQAEGFIDRNANRQEVDRFIRKNVEDARKREEDVGKVPPYLWLNMAPRDLPRAEVHGYLKPLGFQEHFLAEAARRTHFDMDREIRSEKNPIAYLLPEIQMIRELARTQSLRCRLAISEDRIDDAIKILGQQYVAANHLSEDPFYITSLVGISLVAINSVDALHLLQHPQAPNLYWAFETLPRPLVNMRNALGFEHQLLYLQLKQLREVDERPRSAGYWSHFLDRLAPQMAPFATTIDIRSDWGSDAASVRTGLVLFVAAAYPNARDYLINDCNLPHEQVESYPTAQVVFLAMKRFYDEVSQETEKWSYLPFADVEQSPLRKQEEERFREKEVRLGVVATLPRMLLPNGHSIRVAQCRMTQRLAMLQTIEAIRIYGALHESQLPPSLAVLPFPAPDDPATGQPFQYEVQGDRAVLTNHALSDLQWRLILRFSAP